MGAQSPCPAESVPRPRELVTQSLTSVRPLLVRKHMHLLHNWLAPTWLAWFCRFPWLLLPLPSFPLKGHCFALLIPSVALIKELLWFPPKMFRCVWTQATLTSRPPQPRAFGTEVSKAPRARLCESARWGSGRLQPLHVSPKFSPRICGNLNNYQTRQNSSLRMAATATGNREREEKQVFANT